ncbi:MAG: hypothetical protein WBP69_05130 [Terriglobales bacterium]
MVDIMVPWNLVASPRFLKPVFVLAIGVVGTLAFGQDRTITLSAVPPTVSNGAFTTTKVLALEAGRTLPGQFIIGHGCTQVWDVRVHAFVNGDRTVKYPVIGIVSCPEFESRSFAAFASTTSVKADLKAGQTSHSGGYLIAAKQAIKAGDAIPSLLFMRGDYYSIMSIEPLPQQNGKSDATLEPFLTIFDERLKESDRTLALQAWRASNNALSGGVLNIPGLFKLLP